MQRIMDSIGRSAGAAKLIAAAGVMSVIALSNPAWASLYTEPGAAVSTLAAQPGFQTLASSFTINRGNSIVRSQPDFSDLFRDTSTDTQTTTHCPAADEGGIDGCSGLDAGD